MPIRRPRSAATRKAHTSIHARVQTINAMISFARRELESETPLLAATIKVIHMELERAHRMLGAVMDDLAEL